ncbi:MAG: peptide MFS transporter [Acidobacteriota bacterium]|nr:peptide MFS transporter [Acidobacteriota bacterium]MDW3228518.1 peptide MFS transporter [Acidobacteriota bacterium]MDY0231594.1 peptide MFS transporter [Candidatus Saccharicenans sp.]
MLKKHPRALSYIFFTEMWERVGFYTLMAILVLYMDQILGWSDARKGDWYGLFLALCYFFPLVGGWLGDRVFGRLKTVRAGAAMMAVGYVGLALSSASQITTFILGLVLIAIGTGIFKVNMSVLVGNIYKEKPELKDAGFNIYYMGVNLGAMVAPLIATFNSVVFNSYHLSFWVAAAGLVVALVIFQAGRLHLNKADDLVNIDTTNPDDKNRPEKPIKAEPGQPSDFASESSNSDFKDRILALIILFAIVILFWVAFYQNGFALTLFAARSTISLNWLRPETYQFFEPFFILVLTPLLLLILDKLRQKGKEPSTPRKIFLGMLFMTAAMFIMIIACLRGGNQDRNIMSPFWLIGTYFVVTIAEILISPMGLSYVSKVAPAKISGLMMGGWYLAIAFGSYGSGLLGKFYSKFPHHQYFLILAALLGLATVLVSLSIKKLEQYAG